MRSADKLDRMLRSNYKNWGSDQKKYLRQVLRARDGNRCFYCRGEFDGAVYVPTIEHLTPRSHGEDNSLDNLVLACADCNSRRGSNDFMEHCWKMVTFTGTWDEVMDHARFLSVIAGRKIKVYPRSTYYLIRDGGKL